MDINHIDREMDSATREGRAEILTDSGSDSDVVYERSSMGKVDDVSGLRASPSSPEVFYYQAAVTVTLVLTWITTGLRSSLDGTCLPDQRDRLGVSTQDMSTLFASLSIVGVASGVVFSMGADMWKHRAILIMSVNVFISAATLVAARFVTSYRMFFVLNVLLGLVFTPVDLIGNAVILRTWGERATGPMYAIHFGFGLGASIGPFIARPFLSPDLNCTTTNGSCPSVGRNVSLWHFPEGSRIEIPYLIVGAVFVAVGFALLVLHIIGPPVELQQRMNALSADRQALKDVCHPRSCSNGSLPWTLFFLVTFCLFYVWNCGREIAFGVYLVTFTTESDLHFTKDFAAVFNGIYNGFYMGGRLVSVLLSRWLSIQLMTSVGVLLLLLLHVALAIWGSTSAPVFMVLACSVGFVGSPLWPGLLAWMDRYITVTSTAVVLVHAGAGAGNAILNPLYGMLLEKGLYSQFLLLLALTAIILFVQFAIMQVVGWKQGSRFTKHNNEMTEEQCQLLEQDCK